MTATASDAFIDALVEDDPLHLYEQAPCGFLSTTADGLIVKVNGTLCSWLGHEPDDLVGRRSFVDLLTPGGRIYHETHYAPMLRMHDTVREVALELRRDDGSRLPVLVNATLVRDRAGHPRVVRLAVFDASERRRYERELLAAKDRAEASEHHARELVMTLQQTLVPPVEPQVPGLRLAAAYRPGSDGLLVGGDFYDVFPVGHDDWVAMLGDVSGKGAEAAVITALARWTVRAASVAYPRPSQAVLNLNEVLRTYETERFCTVVVLRLRRVDGGWKAQLCVGGHPPPIFLDVDGEGRALPSHGPLVGLIEEAGFSDDELVLTPGDGILLYTDGVTESRRGSTFFDETGLLRSVSKHGPEPRTLVDGLVEDVMAFRHGSPADDIAVLALRVPVAAGEAPHGSSTG